MSPAEARRWDPQDPDPALLALAATPRLVVALDFDGTCSPLVAVPMQARALPAVAEGIRRLAALPDTVVALVSGRSLDDLRIVAEHDDASPVPLIASHGAQFWLPGEGELDRAYAAGEEEQRDEVIRALRPLEAHGPEVMIEPKRFGVAVHLKVSDPRAAAELQESADAVVTALAPGWRRRTGHQIVEYSSRHDGKDVAIPWLRERYAATGILFAGDDTTDEDALAALGPDDLGVRVGDAPTHARIRAAGPAGIAEILAALVRARSSGEE